MEKNCIFYDISSYFTKYADAYQEHIYCKALFENYFDSIRWHHQEECFFMCYPGYKTKRFIQTKNTRAMRYIVALLFKKNVLR